MKRLSPCVIAALLWACGGSSPREVESQAPDSATPAPPPASSDTTPMSSASITVVTDTRTYRPGDPVELRIRSTDTGSYTFNPCTRKLERENENAVDSWSEVREERMCAMIAHVLDPNSSRVERTELGEELAPGRYRMLLRFSSAAPAARASHVTVYTQPFTVTSTR